MVDLATSANKVTIDGTWSVSPRGGTTIATSPGGHQSFDSPPYPRSASSGESFGLSTLSATASTSVKSSPAPEITTAAAITLTQEDQPIISWGEAMGGGAYRLVSTVRQTVTVAATWSYEVDYNDSEPGWSGPEDRGAGALVSVFLCSIDRVSPGNRSLALDELLAHLFSWLDR